MEWQLRQENTYRGVNIFCKTLLSYQRHIFSLDKKWLDTMIDLKSRLG